jgi:translation initiation factor 2 subunit 2
MSYDDYLDRALEETPEIAGGGERFDVPDPDVRQEGNVTVYENFRATVDSLGRDADDVLKFLRNELGTSGHIDESGRARLTGEFGAGRVAAAIEEYSEEYVLCPECGLPDTRLETEQGVTVLRCEACGARGAVEKR